MDVDDIKEQMNSEPVAWTNPPVKLPRDLTLRERYRRTMFFQDVDTLPNFEFGYWRSIYPLWHEQGLPKEIDNEQAAYAYFGIENWQTLWLNAMGLTPEFEYEVLEEDEKHITYRSAEGMTEQINREGHQSIPHGLDWLLQDRQSWEEHYKPRLQMQAGRIPPYLTPAYLDALRHRDFPLAVSTGSLLGRPRNWIGFENICLMMYDDPELLEEIIETMCRLTCETLKVVLPKVEFDFAFGWEDICFNSGPILSPGFLRDVALPRYRRIHALLNRHGVLLSQTDCDGNLMPILDLLVEGGFTCLFPVEVHGGTDPFAVRTRYPDMRMHGGVDKMVLLKGREAIKSELERLLPLVREGGFIPGVDHRVQADVKLDDYKYYLKLKREIFGVGGRPQYDERGI